MARMRYILFICLFGTSLLQAQIGTKLSADQFKEDLRYLRQALTDIHPTPYRYHSESVFDSLFTAQTASLMDSVAYLDVYKAASKTVALVGCIHTSVGNVKLGKAGRRLGAIPFQFWYDGTSVFLIKSDTLELGLELLSINGIPAAQLAEDIMAFRSADGYNQTFRKEFASVNFNTMSMIILNFPDMVTYQFTNDQSFEINFIGYEKALDAKAKEKVKKKKSPKEKSENPEPITYPFETDSIAYMKMKTFRKPYNKAFVRKAMKQLVADDPEHLVLDFRDNLGGSFLTGLELSRYLVDSTIQLQLEIYDNPYREYMSVFKWQSKKMTLFLNQLFGGAKHRRENGTIYYQYRNKPAKKRHYDGEIYILTNGLSASTTSLTATYLKEYADAKIIGEETGGAAFGNNGSIRTSVELPNSKMKVNFPLVWLDYKLPVPDEGRGVRPDYEIKATLDDKLDSSKSDTQLDQLLKIIQKEEK